jgi:anti-anti-sigma factor
LRGRAETRVALGEGLPRACASSTWTHVEPIGDFAVLQVTGEVDVDAAPMLRDQMRELATKGAVHLIADLSQVDFLDSTGPGALVGGLKRLREAGGSLPLVTGPIKTAACIRQILAVVLSGAGSRALSLHGARFCRSRRCDDR